MNESDKDLQIEALKKEIYELSSKQRPLTGVSKVMATFSAGIDSLVYDLDRARVAKDYNTADLLREQLESIRVGRHIVYRIAVSTGLNGTDWYWTTGESKHE